MMSIEATVCAAATSLRVPETFKYRGLCVSPLSYCKVNPQGNHDLAATDSPVKIPECLCGVKLAADILRVF